MGSPPEDCKHCLGRFLVPDYLLNDEFGCSVVDRIFKTLRIYAHTADYKPDKCGWKYVGTSPRFRSLEDGETIPEYDLKAIDDNGFRVEVTECKA